MPADWCSGTATQLRRSVAHAQARSCCGGSSLDSTVDHALVSVEAGKTAFTSEFTLGSIGISLGDVVAFGLTVWASFLVSGFVQFMLDEEVYPRAKLGRGLPYAISRTLHYTILLSGLLLGVAALGFDMTKFTILAGAFTVGVASGCKIFHQFRVRPDTALRTPGKSATGFRWMNRGHRRSHRHTRECRARAQRLGNYRA
jgi:hypothetical protein